MLQQMKDSEMFCIHHQNTCKCSYDQMNVVYRYSSEELHQLMRIANQLVKIYPQKLKQAELDPFLKECAHPLKFTKPASE
mmetsp:Transcript_412/g.374  ORF Transcript_412/g.374 Transcript_412/m.374 type:complete len:80 (-) Transcript_412:26-265(-)